MVGVEAQANGLKCLFSDKVTRESNLLQSTEFISLADGKVWRNKILDSSIMRKIQIPEKNNRMGRFCIEESSIRLQDIYEKLSR